MNKYDFINQLNDCLVGNVSDQERRDSVEYYRNYIEDEMRNGKTEQEVLDELESPNSIAKAIIEAKGFSQGENQFSGSYSAYEEEKFDDDRYNKAAGKVFHAEGWKAKLIIAAVILIIILVLSFVFKLFLVIVPVLLPFVLIALILKMIFDRR